MVNWRADGGWTADFMKLIIGPKTIAKITGAGTIFESVRAKNLFSSTFFFVFLFE